MPTQSKQPNRQSIRLRGWDYTSPGWYFATINTHHGTHRFGTIINGRMVLNQIGKIAVRLYCESPFHILMARKHKRSALPYARRTAL